MVKRCVMSCYARYSMSPSTCKNNKITNRPTSRHRNVISSLKHFFFYKLQVIVVYYSGGLGHFHFVGWQCPVLSAELPLLLFVRDGPLWTVSLVRAFPWDVVCTLLSGARRFLSLVIALVTNISNIITFQWMTSFFAYHGYLSCNVQCLHHLPFSAPCNKRI